MEEEYTFLTPGQKLQNIRSELDITQDELSNGKLTRAVISNIENGTRRINYTYARLVIEQIDLIEEKTGKSLFRKVTEEYILEDVETQVKIVIKNIVDSLKSETRIDKFTKLLASAEKIFSNYHFDKIEKEYKTLIYDLAIDFYIKNYTPNSAQTYALKSLKLYIYQKNDYKVFLTQCKLVKIYWYQSNYDKIINIAEEIYLEDKKIYKDQYNALCFNTASAYYFLKQYKNCLEWLEKVDVNDLLLDRQLQIVELKANALSQQKEFVKAELEYNYIINTIEQNDFISDIALNDTLANSFSNLSDICRQKGDITAAQWYIDKALSIDINKNFINMNVNYNAFLVAMAQKNNSKVKVYFDNVLDFSAKVAQFNVQQELLDYYMDYCCANNLSTEIKLILEILRKINNPKINIVDLYYKAALFFDLISKEYSSELLKEGSKYLKRSQFV